MCTTVGLNWKRGSESIRTRSQFGRGRNSNGVAIRARSPFERRRKSKSRDIRGERGLDVGLNSRWAWLILLLCGVGFRIRKQCRFSVGLGSKSGRIRSQAQVDVGGLDEGRRRCRGGVG